VSTEEPMSIEDRVRTATRAGATLVRDICPMAAEPEKVRSRRRPAPLARRWGTWGIPLAAAAAVVLVALSLVAVRQFGASAPTSGGPATTAPATVPRYYVVLEMRGAAADGYTGNGDLIVGDDLTGKAIATVTPPHGVGFDSVQGASDDRTFVVRATNGKLVGTGTDIWYLLRITPGSPHPYRLTTLPITLPSSSPDGIAEALSPDDRELAVESLSAFSPSGTITRLALYSVSTGAELRAWTGKFGWGSGQETLSWLSDGRQLAFSDIPPGADLRGQLEIQMRILDVTGSGADLVTASRALLTLESPSSSPSNCWTMNLTPDGGTVVCGTQYAFADGGPGTAAGCANGGLEFTAYPVRTGKPVRVLYKYQYRGACHGGLSSPLWTDASATEIIGATQIDVANEGGRQAGQIGVIADGHIRLLKLPKSVSPTYYGIVAF
jgi:hypothetical protein